MFDLTPAEWTAILLSLRVAVIATLVATPFGIAMAESVRAALTLVARGEAALGIVYSTDAKVEPGVKIVGTFPADTHPPIIYPVAATTTAKPETADYLAFLRSSAAKTIGVMRPKSVATATAMSACRCRTKPSGV